MALGHEESRRAARRAFRPTIDGRLETRVLLSATAIRAQTAAGGQAVVVTNTNGERFFVSVNSGTIRGFAAPGGRVSFVVDGSTLDTLMEINQIIPARSPTKGAHTFKGSLSKQTGILNVASITVTSGSINAIEGYRDAVLSGPITIAGAGTVNRIAFLSIQPGGSIGVGGDLNTLDVLNNANFNRSTGVSVGRDLNWFEVGGNLTVDGGARIVVGRDLGLVGQPAKGSGLAGQGLFVNGNLTIGSNGESRSPGASRPASRSTAMPRA